MPGLFGVFSKVPTLAANDLSRIAKRMASSMKSVPWLKVDMWGDNTFCGGRVHLGVLNPDPQPMINEQAGQRVWFDGEVYHPGSIGGITPNARELTGLLSGSTVGLTEIDGTFALACFDSNSHQLSLANDRLGFRPLYYTETKEWFAYAPEVKALLAILNTLPDLDEVALRQFFGFGHMLGERTWWRGIELMPPASVWRISRSGPHRHQYWSFDNIRHDPQPEPEVLEEFGRLWTQAVSQRSKQGTSPILLSGGLDSRLVLAELHEQGKKLVAITFGSEDCPDMQIARGCAKIAQVPHRSLVLNRDNWWEGRENAIWQTDGLVNSMHLHAVIAREDILRSNSYSPMNMAGDLLFGGSYLTYFGLLKWPSRPEDLLGLNYLGNPFFEREEVVAASIDDALSYIRGPRSDCYFLSQRVRRFTLNGPLAIAPYCEMVYPSMSMPLLELFLGGLTNAQRAGAKFYTRFLVSRYPKFFRGVPWQKTGRALAESLPTRIGWNIRRKIGPLASHVRGGWRISRLCAPDKRVFADYPTLLNGSDVLERLLNKDLLVDQVLSGAARRLITRRDSIPGPADTLIGILTMETMLRKATGISSALDTNVGSHCISA